MARLTSAGFRGIIKDFQLAVASEDTNWNECPPADVQTAICKYWHQKYGAEIACVSGDILECIVANPPQDRLAADELAREQYLFCTDIVDQGVGSLPTLGKTLLGCKYWYFWWD
jgi:hypothetical protein